MKTAYQHELDGDVPIGQAWVDRSHYEKHIEIAGGSGQGKTTLVEWLMLGVLERTDAGMLLVDPTGDSARKWLGWLAEGTVQRPCYLVDVTGPVLRYNPLAVEKEPKRVASHVAGLFEALHLIQSDTPAGQHRQMQRFVTATLRALIESDLTLADAYWWLTDETFRAKHLAKITHPETRAEWQRGPSKNDLKSTENWFAAFWEHDWLKAMYSGNGFDWARVYDEQAVVLLNLRGLFDSVRYSRAVAALFLTGLLTAASSAERPKRWYAVIDDATNYTPTHVGPILTLGRHFDLFLVLIRHQEFQGSLQRAVDVGCRTKFIFGGVPKEYQSTTTLDDWRIHETRTLYATETERVTASRDIAPRKIEVVPAMLPAFRCLYVHDGRPQGIIDLERTPEFYGDVEAFKAKVFSHAWYGEAPKEPPQRVARLAPASPPPIGADPKSERPRARQDRRGK